VLVDAALRVVGADTPEGATVELYEGGRLLARGLAST